MKLISLLNIVLVFICAAQAGVYSEKYFRDCKHPGKCVIDGTVLSPGQSTKHPSIDCAEITCDNSIGMATIETCDPLSVLASPLQKLKDYDRSNPPKCTWGDFKNPKAEYPKCCERHFTCMF